MLSQLFRKKNPSELSAHTSENLLRSLGVVDLTAMGIAAIIGAGIFATIGRASFEGGPAVSLLFIFTALACMCSALCYAHFASSIHGSGSAYTYAYVAFGEIIAWIIGWDLLMEYAIGNIAVAISWSDYFSTLLTNTGFPLPEYITIDYLSAQKYYYEYIKNPSTSSPPVIEGYLAWIKAPALSEHVKIILDIPALLINLLITILVYRGINESKRAGNILVFIKLLALLLVLAVGSYYVNPDNWHPFAPNGITGIFKGTAAVFFAYIGFDAISTTAEECKNPQRDLPRAMFAALLISTLLYVLITLVLTGMISYQELNVSDPLAYVFEKYNLYILADIVAISALVAMTGVLLVFQLGQPRILLSMSRDGLLPAAFARIHPHFRTPSFSTVITGLMVAIPILFLNHTIVTDLCTIGTLFAFALVCAGALFQTQPKATFLIPYYPSRYTVCFVFLGLMVGIYYYYPAAMNVFFTSFNPANIPTYLFLLYACYITYRCIVKNLSLIPVLGLSANLYLMTELGLTNWLRFLVWLVLGLAIYFLYRMPKLKKYITV